MVFGEEASGFKGVVVVKVRQLKGSCCGEEASRVWGVVVVRK